MLDMAEKIGAILLDTRSIQKYVFFCNKLKTNIGASHLVDQHVNNTMKKVLEVKGFKNLVTDWNESDSLQMSEKDSTVDCEIAYAGGGNMLVLVRKDEAEDIKELCKGIVKEWSEKLLLGTPGLKTGAAISDNFIIDSKGFQNSLNALYEKLKYNQNNIIPEVDLPYTGLTLECDYSGKTADFYDDSTKRFIAAEVKAKLDARDACEQDIRAKYSDILKDADNPDIEYDFCSEIEQIGYRDKESYICVIHIDGNNMGVKFSGSKTMKQRKILSKKSGLQWMALLEN